MNMKWPRQFLLAVVACGLSAVVMADQAPSVPALLDMTGKSASLDQYKGRVVLVNYWATWCGPCLQEMPDLEELYQKIDKKHAAVVGIAAVKIEPGAGPAPEGEPSQAPAAPPAATPVPAKPAAGGMRKKILMGVAAVAVLAAGWMGVNWFVDGRFNITTDNAQLRSDIARVTPKIEGYVKTVHVAENQQVKQGDLLIELVDDEYVLRLAHAKANLAQAEFYAAEARARISVQRDTLAEARAAREAADATADLSSSDVKRLAELSAKGWYPKAKLEQAEAARRSATAQLTQADASITAQRSQLSSAQAAALSAEAKVANIRPTRYIPAAARRAVASNRVSSNS